MAKRLTTIWEYSADTETQRVLYTARQITHGFYQTHNFFVLSKLNGTANHSVVIFPPLNYCSIHNFWGRVKNIDIDHLPLQVEPKLFCQTKELVNLTPLNFKPTQTLWQKAEKEILGAIAKLIPSPGGLVRSLTIWPTNFGTSCSFNLADSYPADIIIFLRYDCGVRQISEAILTSLIRKKMELNSQNGRLLLQANAYLKKLGVVPPSAPELNRLANLSLREKNLLRVLLQKRGQIVSLDEISDIISAGNSTPEFSLYAISKTLERLRKKLEENNLSGALIQTVRKQGWMLG